MEDVPIHLLMVGDWGVGGNQTDQAMVAAALRNYQTKWSFKADSLLMLGDNFYDGMPGGVTSPRWQSTFEQMYPASDFNCPVYAVPGNHDYELAPESKVDAEFAYSALGTSRWTMPSRYWSMTMPAANPYVTLYFVDSNMPNERAQPLPPNPNFYTATDAQRQEQLDWLTTELNKPKATTFRVVVGHHPLYSNGPHGDNNTLIRDWDPLFRAHKVDMYLAGHDHDLQHLEFAGHPTSFVSSGGGGATLNALDNSSRGPFGMEVHGFTHLHASAQQLTLRHLGTDGGLLHKFSRTADGTVTILH